MGRRSREWGNAAQQNRQAFLYYYDRLREMAIARFNWINIPDTLDERFIEMTLFNNSSILFFEDDTLGLLALPVIIAGPLNVYNIPMRRRAYTPGVGSVGETDKEHFGSYQAERTNRDSVICYNNLLHTSSVNACRMYALRLAELDRTIDVNIKAQKTPVAIETDLDTKLSMQNAYAQFDGNMPVMFVKKGIANNVAAITTGAPLVAPQLQLLKQSIWNEALEYLGIANHGADKKERVNTLEVMANQGGTIASRYSGLVARQQACEAVNRMFGTDIWVEYREDITPDSGEEGDEA